MLTTYRLLLGLIPVIDYIKARYLDDNDEFLTIRLDLILVIFGNDELLTIGLGTMMIMASY